MQNIRTRNDKTSYGVQVMHQPNYKTVVITFKYQNTTQQELGYEQAKQICLVKCCDQINMKQWKFEKNLTSQTPKYDCMELTGSRRRCETDK